MKHPSRLENTPSVCSLSSGRVPSVDHFSSLREMPGDWDEDEERMNFLEGISVKCGFFSF